MTTQRFAKRRGGSLCLLALLGLPLAGCSTLAGLFSFQSPNSAVEAETINAQEAPAVLAGGEINPETSSSVSGAAGSLPAATTGNSGPAVEKSAADSALPEDSEVTDEALLDEQRGGFDLGGGLVVSFGIQQAAYINGQLVSSQSLNLADVSKLVASAQGILASGGLGNLAGFTLVQSGPGNSVGNTTGNSVVPTPASSPTAATASASPASAAASSATAAASTTTAAAAPTPTASATASPVITAPVVNTGGVIIQNTVKNAVIQTQTILNITANSLQLLRNMNLQSSIREAVLSSLRK